MESASRRTPATLQIPSRVPPHIITFLDHHFKTQQDLSTAPSLISELNRDCSDLCRDLDELIEKLSLAASDWTSRSTDIKLTLHRHIQTCCPLSPDGNEMMGCRQKRILGVELPTLAKEVARIETVRLYAETTLKLEVLVGDLEDATLSFVNHTSRNNSFKLPVTSIPHAIGQDQAKLLLAIRVMNHIEEILVDVAKSRPFWTSLLMAVDSRVEKALATLRPQVLSDHRILLASIGWPPPLSTSKVAKGNCLDIPNPLVLMQGQKKEEYSQSFLELSALQHLQMRREARQHFPIQYGNGHKVSDSMDFGKQPCFRDGLWPIDELVKPIAPTMEHHFSWWSDEPKLIFALVEKIIRDFLDAVDGVLQPLIDKADLVGCSAKEAWVSAMVKNLSRYLERQNFPSLFMNYYSRVENMVINSSWLTLIDLMINFDKKMKVLATSGTPMMGSFQFFDGLLQSQLLFSIFDEHPDWLQMWAEIELKDAQQKLNSEIEDEKNWLIATAQQDGLVPDVETETFLLSTREDYKAPLIADSAIRISWAMIERGQFLPSKSLRSQFIRSSAILFLNHFFIFLLQRCQDMDFITAILEDDALGTAVGAVNTARYCESVLHEWNEGINFVDMAMNDQHLDSSFLRDEMTFLAKLETDCLVEIVSALLLQFDASSLEYINGIKQWVGEQNRTGDRIVEHGDMSISPAFVGALDMLRDRLRFLRLNLNSKDFSDLWRSTAGGLDHFVFSSIPLSRVKFSRQGIDQFVVDARALFLVFKAFCARPEAFFPCTNDSLKLLTMDRKDADHLLGALTDGKRSDGFLRERGLFHVSVAQAKKILRGVKFEILTN